MRFEEKFERNKKKPRNTAQKRTGITGWLIAGLLKLIAMLTAVVLICGLLLYALPPALFAVEPEGINLAVTDGLPLDTLNVLLIGTDELRDGHQRSDAMIVASIGYGKFRLTSFMRDMVVQIPEHGENRLNAAYAYGGPELLMRTINQNFGLNIVHYAQVDYVALVRVVDAIGGVELTVTDTERTGLNKAMLGMRNVFQPLGYTAHELTQYGEHIHLDGLQALAYARLRKPDNDFNRTGRQRKVMEAIVERIKAGWWNPALLTRLSRTVMESVHTNMSALQVLSLGAKAMLASERGQLRLPVDGSYESGSKLKIKDFNMNRDAFMKFVYD